MSCLELGTHFSSKSSLYLVSTGPSSGLQQLTGHAARLMSQAFAKCLLAAGDFSVFAGLPFSIVLFVELFTPLTSFSYVICKVFACSGKQVFL